MLGDFEHQDEKAYFEVMKEENIKSYYQNRDVLCWV